MEKQAVAYSVGRGVQDMTRLWYESAPYLSRAQLVGTNYDK